MPNKSPRKFSREFKLEAVRRILAGEQIRALSEELTVLRKDLYAWRKLFRAGGAEALRPLGRPRKGDGVVASRVKSGRAMLRLATPARQNVLPNLSARSASSRSNSIFFDKPCGGSGKHAGRTPELA